MPTLAETQELFRLAVVTGEPTGAYSLLESSRRKRLAIHRRNYQASLVHALLGKFPAVVWLVGTPFVTEAARRFVERHPPQRPCIAEYGETFPRFLSTLRGAERTPYLESVGALEWHIGHMTIAVMEQPISMEEISLVDPKTLPEIRLRLQHGVRYLQASWPVDELMKLYLTDAAPDRLVFDPADVFLEIRGSRGEFQMSRLEEAEFRFCDCLVQGLSIGAAADEAMDSRNQFDVGASLVRLITDGLVAAITTCDLEEDL